MALSPQQEMMNTDVMMRRTVNRKLSTGSIFADVVIATMAILIVAYSLNAVRLNVYQPVYGRLDVWFIWRAYTGFWCTPLLPLFYATVMYQTSIFTIVYIILSLCIVVLNAWGLIGMLVDLNSCSTHLWCAYLDTWDVTAGAPIFTALAANAANGKFLAPFWMTLAMVLMIVALIIVCISMEYVNKYRTTAYTNSAVGRTMALIAGDIGGRDESEDNEELVDKHYHHSNHNASEVVRQRSHNDAAYSSVRKDVEYVRQKNATATHATPSYLERGRR